MLIGAAVFGDEWFERADPFEVYSSLVAKLSPVGPRRAAGSSCAARWPTSPPCRPAPGLLAVVAVLFGSTAFDSYKDTIAWQRFVLDVGEPRRDAGEHDRPARLLPGGGRHLHRRRDVDRGGAHRAATPYAAAQLPTLLAHSVIPIIVGYITAHYLTYFVEQGQATLIQLSDPMVRGDNLLGTADWSVNYWLSFHPTLLAVLKVLAIVTGHIVGVVAAHDRAIRLLPARHHVTGQLGMLRGDGRLHRDRALPADGRLLSRRAAGERRRPSDGVVATARAAQRRVAELDHGPCRRRGRGRWSARSSGRKCTPAGADVALDHPDDVAPAPAERVAHPVDHHRHREAAGVAQLDQACGPAARARSARPSRPRPRGRRRRRRRG